MCSWIGRIHLNKMSGLSKLICGFNTISIKSLISCRYQETSSKICMERQEPRIANTILKKNVGGLKLSDFETYYKATVIKTT